MSLKKKLDKLVKERPQYQINSEVTDNQAIARNAANGRDVATVNAETQVAQNAANAVASAKNSSSSSAGILAATMAINANTNAANTNLATQEAQIKDANRAQVMATNAAMAEEKDKAWNQNVNEPYQNQVQALRERRKNRQELLMKGLDTLGAVVGTAVAAGTGGATKVIPTVTGTCWVARAIYGEDNPQWMMFRTWLITCAPAWFREAYTIHGEEFANFLNKYPFIKPLLKPFFDSRVKYMNNLTDGLQRV